MSSNFSLEEVLEIEQAAIAALPENTPYGDGYFKEIVAQELYKAWLLDHSDHRLLIYCFPLIQSIMVKHVQMLKKLEMEEGEIFNTLCLNLITAFWKYSISRGRLFTFCTLIMHFRVKDLSRNKHANVEPLEDWDMQVSDDGFHMLEDFKGFLRRLETGPTAGKQIKALLEILECPKAQALCLNQDRIQREMSSRTGLPRLIVDPFYRSLLARFEHSVLD